MPERTRNPPPKPSDWHHAPVHRLRDPGAYLITSGTYLKQSFFNSRNRLDFLSTTLLALAKQYDWQLQAWCIFPNHYHFAGESTKPETLRQFIRHLHSVTAKHVNALDGKPGRRVWFEYWDTNLRDQDAHVAALQYVQFNAVRHGLVKRASEYPWCSDGRSQLRIGYALDSVSMPRELESDGFLDDYEVGSIEAP